MLRKEEIFEILATWNYWDKPLPQTVSRPAYEKEIARKSGAGEILILKGVRRSGKSTLLLNEIKRIIAAGHDIRNVLYVNFEDPRF
ncbi:MAG: AAA family ATPase, partial [Thermodesulfobacteriota bacterium]|nr:AAA family ATPase [Thermodesulfobacteriota bacterium]